MSIDQDDDEQIDDTNDDTDNYSAPAADPVLVALELCKLANNKTVAAAIKKLRRLDRQFADTQAKVAALTTEAERMEAALAARAAELAAREAEIERRATEFENSLQEARDNLREYHNSITDADRRIRRRILSSADLLVGFNERLQDLPDWPAIRQMVPGLPADPPELEHDVAAPPRIDFSDTFSDPNADRHGVPFLGSLTRSTSHKASQ